MPDVTFLRTRGELGGHMIENLKDNSQGHYLNECLVCALNEVILTLM